MKKTAIYILALFCLPIGAFAQTSYSLEACKELAAKNNIKLKNAGLEISASQEVKDAAYTKYFPNVSATGLAMYSFDNLVEIETPGGNLPVYDGNPANLANATQFAYMPASKMSMLDNLTTGSLMVMQPLYAGGRISTGNALASLGKEISQDKFNIERYNVNQKTEELYRQAVTLQNKMRTLEFFEKFLNQLLKDVGSAYSAGLVSKNDALKVSIKLNEINLNKLKLNNGIEMVKEALCQHIGIAKNPDMILSDTIMTIDEPKSFYIDPNAALGNRYETQLLDKAVKAEALQSELKQGEYMPEVAVGGALAYVNVMEKSDVHCILLANVSVPISGWWEASHTMQERVIKEEIMRNTAKETSELLVLQMSKAWKDLNEAYKQIELGENMVAQAKENFRDSESNYKVGVIGISDFLEAQALLQNAEDALAEYKSNYQINKTKYLQAVGKY